jgi:hypothetical protein
MRRGASGPERDGRWVRWRRGRGGRDEMGEGCTRALSNPLCTGKERVPMVKAKGEMAKRWPGEDGVGKRLVRGGDTSTHPHPHAPCCAVLSCAVLFCRGWICCGRASRCWPPSLHFRAGGRLLPASIGGPGDRRERAPSPPLTPSADVNSLPLLLPSAGQLSWKIMPISSHFRRDATGQSVDRRRHVRSSAGMVAQNASATEEYHGLAAQ